MTKVLVTGGAGYVGAHACKALSAAGFLPVVYDDLSLGNEDAVRWGPFERGDVADRRRLDAVIAAHAPAAVLHFAARSNVGESVRDPGAYYGGNVAGTLTLLEAMRDAGIGTLVFSSSCAVYGMPDRVPVAESCPKAPISPYGHSKLMAEQMMADFDRAHGLRWMALRYFNAAGADPDGEIGEAHEPETHLIPLVLDAAAGRRSAIAVYGTDCPTPDGTCIRDYVHVSDLADGHVGALRALLGGAPSDAFNLGAGHGHSVLEIVEAARAHTGRDIAVSAQAGRPGDPPALVADTTRASAALGWRPERSDLDTILRTAWRWHAGRPGS